LCRQSIRLLFFGTMNDIKSRDGTLARPTLPLVRLSLIMPFVEELDQLGVDADVVLASNGLVRQSVADTSIFVPSMVVHRFLEDAATAAHHPYLGARVGERLDLAGWPPFVDAASRASTLGEFFTRFIQAAKDEASSARHVLEISSGYSYFKEMRTTHQEMAPAQNDAFTAAFTLRLLQHGTGAHWDPGEVRITVCDPTALPDAYMGASFIGGDRMGMVARFPTEWLVLQLDRQQMSRTPTTQGKRLKIPVGFLDGFRQVLILHLHDPGLSVDLAARLSGMSRQSLQRLLKSKGTTLSAEITALKKRRAIEYLTETQQSVAQIAGALGFTDATSFSRAFKSWTGESPRDYRKKWKGK